MARRCGLSRSAICHYVYLRRFPCPETMRKILLATNGEVTPNDFYNQAMQ